MAKKSIGQLHSEITANAAQFVNEFKRADNEQRRASANIRASVRKLVHDVEKDFSLQKFGKGLLGGLGLGGGIELARTGVEFLADKFKEGAEHAKEMAEAIEKMREELRALHDQRFGSFLEGVLPGQQQGVIDRELAKQRQLLDAAEKRKSQAERDMQEANGMPGFYRSGQYVNDISGEITPDTFGGRYGIGKSPSEIFDSALEVQSKAGEEILKLQSRIQELSTKGAKSVEDATKAVDKALDDFFKPIDSLSEQLSKHMESQADKMREGLRTPQEKFDESIALANDLWRRGLIDDRTLNRSTGAAADMFRKDTDPFNSPDYKRWERAAEMHVDDLTKRGLGTGADYKGVQEQTNSILTQILQAIRENKAAFIPAAYAN